MAKHQIFIVHGMGEHADGWSSDIQQKFLKLFTQYDGLRGGDWDQQFEFHEINYDQVFNAWRAQWAADAGAAAALLKPLGLDGGSIARLLDLMSHANRDGFLRTHVLDVVLFRFLPQITFEVMTLLSECIRSKLLASNDGLPPPYSVIAHSLGTAVAYQGFFRLIKSQHALSPELRPVNVFMISNVIRSMWSLDGDCYPSDLAPDLVNDRGLCTRFLNAAHKLDPFCRFAPFDPPPAHWMSSTAPAGSAYLSVTLPANHLHGWNVHDLWHYLSHPDVHAPMLRWLSQDSSCITKSQQRQAVVKWLANSPLSTGASKQAVIAKLQPMIVKGSGSGFLKEIEALLSYQSKLLGLAAAGNP